MDETKKKAVVTLRTRLITNSGAVVDGKDVLLCPVDTPLETIQKYIQRRNANYADFVVGIELDFPKE